MIELLCDEYKTWQEDPICQVCDNSEMGVADHAINLKVFPSPRKEIWSCGHCGTEYIDTINIRVEWTPAKYLYGREPFKTRIHFEREDGNSLELATVSWSGVDADTVAWPDESLAGLVNTFFGEAVFESMLQDYVNGMMRDGAPVKVDNLGPHMIPETLGFFRAIEI